MPNTYTTLSALFTAIANAIRSKTGSSSQIVADNFPTEIANIPTGIDPSDATAVAGDILSGKTAYISGGKTTGNMTDRGAVSQSVTPSGTAQSVSIAQGYHNGNGSVSVGAVTKNSGIGQTLYNEGVSDTKVGTAGTGQVLSGYTFTNGTSVGASGSMTNRGAWTSSVTPSSSAQTVNIPAGYHNGSGSVSVGAASVSLSRTLVATKTTSTSGGLLGFCTITAGTDFTASAYTTYGLVAEPGSSNINFSVSVRDDNGTTNYTKGNSTIASSASVNKNFVLYSTASVPSSLVFTVSFSGGQYGTSTMTAKLYQYSSSELISALQL